MFSVYILKCRASIYEEAFYWTVTVQLQPGELLTLQLDGVKQFKQTCPEQYDALIESTAFVNWRRIDQGDNPILIISFYG